MKNFSIYLTLTYSITIIIGGVLGYSFRNINDNEHLPNIISLFGIGIDFIGVVLVSDSFLKINEKYKMFQELILGTVIAFPFMLTIGAISYSVISILFQFHYSTLYSKVLGVVAGYVGCSLYGLDAVTDAFNWKLFKSVVSRANIYGWFLLLSGLTMQMIAVGIQIFGST